jgi:glycosyltransferase involved in cell wall biosynthesis
MLIARFPPLGGGTELQALRLSGALRAAGVGVFVVTARVAGLPAAATVEGVPVRRTFAPGPLPLSSLLFCCSSLLHLLRRRRDFALVHAHLASSHALAALALRAALGTPVVVKLGGGRETGDIGTSLRRPWGRWKLRRIARRADRVIAPSRAVAEEAAAFGFPAARICVIPNGVDTAAFSPATGGERDAGRARLGLPAGAPVGVFTGRLEPGKGLETLLELWPHLGPDACLLLVGDGSLRRPLAARHASERVRFVGPAGDVRPFLHAADLFFLPSAGEGLSNALLEAMSCGLVPVVSAIPANTEAVTDGADGFVVDFTSREPALAALRAILGGRAGWAALGAAARRTVEARFSLERARDAHRALYASLVRPAGTPARPG